MTLIERIEKILDTNDFMLSPKLGNLLREAHEVILKTSADEMREQARLIKERDEARSFYNDLADSEGTWGPRGKPPWETTTPREGGEG